MRTWHTIAAVAVLSTLGAGITLAQSQSPAQTPPSTAQAQQPPAGSPGMMGDGMGMRGMGHHQHHQHRHMHGMMGGGTMMHGPGMGMAGPVTPETVAQTLAQRIAHRGNPRVKLGAVAQAADGTITAEIVTTKENALVDRFAVDPKTGMWRRVD